MARYLIVEADGGSRGNPGPAAYGTIVRDGITGLELIAAGQYLGEVTNNVAEYQGTIAGLTWAKELDPNAEVEVRLDSKLVVEQMSGRWKIKHADMRSLALRARAIFPDAQVRYVWVPRERNAAADAVVNEVLDAVMLGRDGAVLRRNAIVDSGAVEHLASMDVVGAAAEHPAHPVTRLAGWNPEVGSPTTLVAVRHGATAYSIEKRFSGLGGADMPLNELGIAQAHAVAKELVARGGADVLVSSPLLRTRQTSAIIGEAIQRPVEIIDDFAECSFGQWDGLTFDQVQQQWPDELSAWLNSARVAPPSGESFDQINDRVNRAREWVIARHGGKRVIVVAHVTPIKLMVTHTIAAPLTSLFRMELSPCSITTLTWFADGNASVFGFSESAHIRDLHVPGV